MKWTLLVAAFLIFSSSLAFTQEKKTVKLGELVLTIESIEVKRGLELLATKDKDIEKLAPFIPDLLKEERDNSKLSDIEWLSLGDSYLVVKYCLTNKGKSKSLYVSPAARYDAIMKSKSDEGKILSQARMFSEDRPKFCLNPGVQRIAKDKEIKDAFIIKAPSKDAKSVDIEIFTGTILPATIGTLKLNIPFDKGKPAGTDKVKVEFKAPEKKKATKIKTKGKVRLGKIQVDLVDITTKSMNLLDKESDMVFSDPEERTVISLKITNKGSKPVKYAPILLQKTLPGIAVENTGKYCPFLSMGDKTKILECFDLKESIPAKSEITDYVLLDMPSGTKALRLVLISNQVLLDLKRDSGIMIFSVKFKDGTPSKICSGVMKRSVSLNNKSLMKMLDETAKSSDEAWDNKYSGLLVSGTADVLGSDYYDGDDVTVVMLKACDNAVSETEYGYVLILNGCHSTYIAGDKVSFKAIILNNEAKKAERTLRNLVVYGLKHARTNR